MSNYDVLCIGSATIDTFLSIEQPFSSLKSGDKVLVKSSGKYSGGGAANSAAALSRLGLKVKTLTKLSRDHDADFIKKDLKKYRVENICLSASREMTDSATVVYSLKEKDRIIFVHKGASTDLSRKDFKESQFKCRWIYLASLTGKSFQTIPRIVKIARKKNLPLLFNPSLYLAKKGKNILKPVLKNTVVLVMNKAEAQALTGTSSKSIFWLLKELRGLGPKAVVITDGRKGFAALQNNMVYHTEAMPDVKIIDTTGAGDAFTSGLLFGIIKRYPFEDALRLGQVNASSVLQHLGAKNELLTEKEAKAMMKKYRIIITKTRV